MAGEPDSWTARCAGEQQAGVSMVVILFQMTNDKMRPQGPPEKFGVYSKAAFFQLTAGLTSLTSGDHGPNKLMRN
jgi:hypothetical protein